MFSNRYITDTNVAARSFELDTKALNESAREFLPLCPRHRLQPTSRQMGVEAQEVETTIITIRHRQFSVENRFARLF